MFFLCVREFFFVDVFSHGERENHRKIGAKIVLLGAFAKICGATWRRCLSCGFH